MRLAEELGARSISFPSISTGAYGYPLRDAAEVAIRTVAECLRRGDSAMQRVSFVLFGEAAFETHLEVARRELGS
jgi:O-acetyl-ADP-ribose deacetylase (regulator of RNase III)